MEFYNVAVQFDKIAAVSARLEITSLLADLFAQATPEEAKIISYLSLGILRPSYQGMQFNFAKKNLVAVIAELTGKTVKEVESKAKELGDLGLAVEQLDTWRQTQNSLTVSQVYDQLVELEQISGIGSTEQKQAHALRLLQQLPPESAKYVIRIILGTLRLGFSDMTVIDALSWMEVGTKKLRPIIEHAYNVCADIGLIAQTLKADGVQAVKDMHIHLGIPIRLAAAERMPSAQALFEKIGNCVAQPKLDGFRLQIHLDKSKPDEPKVAFFSRNLIDMTHMFPDLAQAVEQLDVTTLICEGEAIVFDPHTKHFLPFQETVKRKRKHGIEEAIAEYPLQVYLFDLLYLNGKSLLAKSHERRRQALIQVFDHSNLKGETVQIIGEQSITSSKELEDYFHHNIALGLEGIVAKKPDAIYQPGKRNFNWIKLKRIEEGQLEDTIDCVVLGYYSGAGKRVHFGIGAFLVGIYNKKEDSFQTIAKIGTGLSDEQWIALKNKLVKLKVDKQPINVECDKQLYPDVWVQPSIVCEILADEITRSPLHRAGKTSHELGYALRFPRFIGYCIDKTPQQATSLEEIKHLYKDQFEKKQK